MGQLEKFLRKFSPEQKKTKETTTVLGRLRNYVYVDKRAGPPSYQW